MTHFLIHLELRDVPEEKKAEVNLHLQAEMEDLAFRSTIECDGQKCHLPSGVYLIRGDGLTTDIVRSIASCAASLVWHEYSLLVCQLAEGEDTILWGNLREAE